MHNTRSLAHIVEAVAPFARFGASGALDAVHLRSYLCEPAEGNSRHAAIRQSGATESLIQQACRRGAGSRGIWLRTCLRRGTVATQ